MSKPLWSDEQRPWVSENLNGETELRTAARIIRKWNLNWHATPTVSRLYAYNNIMGMADSITYLLTVIDKHQAELDKLKGEHHEQTR